MNNLIQQHKAQWAITQSYDTWLPEGVAVVWWAARSLLCEMLDADPINHVRDIDYVLLQPSTTLMADMREELSNMFWCHPYEAEQSRDIEGDYFETRDFTINEVYATPNTIVYSPQCLEDTIQWVIQSSKNTHISARERAKWTRFSLISDWIYTFPEESSNPFLNYFEVGLQLLCTLPYDGNYDRALRKKIVEKFNVGDDDIRSFVPYFVPPQCQDIFDHITLHNDTWPILDHNIFDQIYNANYHRNLSPQTISIIEHYENL